MPVHDVAREGFGREATTYERSRPTYPPDAVAWIARHLRLGPGVRVGDLACGTGKLTRLLEPFGARVVGIEPVAGMRATFRSACPRVPLVAATAEELGLRDRALDAVTVAQAFHWFDPPAALAELGRVLRPGGRLALVWNARDRSEAWGDAVWSVMDRVERRAPWRDHQPWSADAAVGVAGAPWFGPVEEATFHHEQRLAPEDVVERVRGVSHVVVLPPAEQEAVLEEVRAIIATHPQTRGRRTVAIPYRVGAYWCERRL